MRHALSTWMTCGLCLGLGLASCTVFQNDDDDDDGGTPVQGSGGGLSFNGGATGAGGNNNGTSGAASSSGGSQALMCEAGQLDVNCGFNKIEADVRIVNMMLVVDKSKSMEKIPTGFTVNKWKALGTALQSALSGVASDINFGLTLYPDGANSDDVAVACVSGDTADAVNVPIVAGAANLTKIISTITNTAPSGGTPTAAALRAAYDYYVNGPGKTLQGEKFVLLATDGGPNCNTLLNCSNDPSVCTSNLDGACGAANCCTGNAGFLCLDDSAVTIAIQALADKGIPTFVVGIPGTEAYATYLDAFAEAGGKVNPAGPEKYYAVAAGANGVQALTDVFATITTQLVKTCDIPLASAPPNPDEVNVAIDCAVVPSGKGENWEVAIDGAATTLVLKGDTCEQVRRGVQRVDVGYGCPEVE